MLVACCAVSEGRPRSNHERRKIIGSLIEMDSLDLLIVLKCDFDYCLYCEKNVHDRGSNNNDSSDHGDKSYQPEHRRGSSLRFTVILRQKFVHSMGISCNKLN